MRQIDNSPAPCRPHGLVQQSLAAWTGGGDTRQIGLLAAAWPIRCEGVRGRYTEPTPCSITLVHVLIARDVVFAEVGAGLDLDEDDVQLAGILEAVHGAEGDVDGLVL